MPRSIQDQEVQQAINDAKRNALNKTEKTVLIDNQSVNFPSPFPSPEDWRDAAPIYEIMIDRFNNPDAAPKMQWNGSKDSDFTVDGVTDLFQGGTFEGIRQKLKYLQELGVKTIWLSPIQKNCQDNKYSYHGYGIQDFLSVEPRFASDQKNPERELLAERELQALINEAHALGIYVIFDIVLNHTGDVFSYVSENGKFDEPISNKDLPDHPYKIAWHDRDGKPKLEWENAPDVVDLDPDAAVWPKELCQNKFFRRKGTRNGDTGDGGDFSNLKEILTENKENPQDTQEIRNILIRIHQYLIAKFDIDGFRIDTLRFIEPEFARSFGNAMREFALSIGKKNFFTFGEVWGGSTVNENEQIIARFIGKNSSDEDGGVGVDAALDFPLFKTLSQTLKGLGDVSPRSVADIYELRKKIQGGIVSSHGEVSKYFVTFLDNHDLNERFYNGDNKYNNQLTLGIACLFALQGIPCLYYGTEQGLHGFNDPDAGLKDLAVRQALWGKPNGGFNTENPFYKAIAELSLIRTNLPALRYGRQYFRPISGDGTNFGISLFSPGVLAFSRILNDTEVVVVANTNTEQPVCVSVVVDYNLNSDRNSSFGIKYSNKPEPVKPDPVEEKSNVIIDGSFTNGPVRIMKVTLQPMEVQILLK